MKLNLRRATMENNFLEAFNNANKLQEGPINAIKTAVANHQVNKQNKANAEKQNAANASADLANENGYQLIIAALQKIANEQTQFDEKSIDEYITNINNIKSLDDKSKKQINQILNQQKAALQQATADKDTTTEENATVGKVPDAGSTTVEAGQVEEKQDVSAGGAGDPSKIMDNNKSTLKDQINRIISKQTNGVSIDDIIAFVQSLKQS